MVQQINDNTQNTKPHKASWILVLIALLGLIFIALIVLTYLPGRDSSRMVPLSLQSMLTADYGADAMGLPLDFSGMPLVAQAIYDAGGEDVNTRMQTLQAALQTPVPSITPQSGNPTPQPTMTATPKTNAGETSTVTATLDPSITPENFTPTPTPILTLTATMAVIPTKETEAPQPTATPGSPLQPPGVVVLVAPEGQTTINPPVFEWEPAERAVKYAFSLTGPEGVVHRDSIPAEDLECADEEGLCIYAPELILADDSTFIFYVLASNDAGYGPLGEEMVFSLGTGGVTPPGEVTLLAPEDADVTDDSTPELVWSAAVDAQWYRVYVRTLVEDVMDAWISAGEACSGQLCTISVAPPLSPGTYGWTVIAYNPGGYGPVTYPFRLDIE